MNPSDSRHPWQRLAAAARRLPDDRDTAAPYGFATRVAALAMASERVRVSLLERFSLRAMGIACLLMVAIFAANYSAIAGAFTDDSLVPGDPVAEMLDGSGS
ncbi:MAG TPA: hypothetical protein VG838_14220 [Opitutaceae bacterium]|nr:hypothetical protein [Opitutaceae bacterium]